MGISSTSSLGTKTITFDELRKTMSSNPSSLASSHQNPSSNSYSQTWERTHQTSAFAPDDFELKTSSDHSGIGKVATAAPPISASLPKKPKIKVEESSPDVSQSQNTAKGGTKAQSYLDESAAYGEQLKVLSELQKTQEKLAKARTRFNEVRSRAAITKPPLVEENSELKRQMLAHMQKFAEVSAELEQLRSTQRESEDALQRQRKDHAEQLTGLRGEMEARKIEALAARFPAASKLLIAAYIRLE